MQQDSIAILKDSLPVVQENLPLYYRETFFDRDTMFHTEVVSGGHHGVAGDPVPYAPKDDNAITSLLVVCFIVSLVSFTACKGFVERQLNMLFYSQKAGQVTSETSGEYRFQVFLILQNCIVQALFYFFYIRNYVADTFILSDEYWLIAILTAVMIGYFILRFLVYTTVNQVFFDSKNNRQFFHLFLFLLSAEGVLLYPAVILCTFFDISFQYIVYYVFFMIGLVKIVLFYKTYLIFFRQNGLYLQNILYFCALEIIPLLALGGGLEVMTNALKINF